ncbi:ABC transporter permease [Tsukamurella ocularis]|uniref:ABC transporter permease n=1 Tax=Tsukamurella ocularis TaxID=1970234 RepID=UPI00286E22EE|nr:iron ABC transporter permease [Tsukamurella ocularis]MCS3780717.1 thiamine transport system permease protein [Tsukamurella ocularis]MCS3786541.1 thiamine transport system permease protein [Tsukamurella ocularis]MCS3850383.1 thiamine transport system permease protein [Tsukamurella ocularis]
MRQLDRGRLALLAAPLLFVAVFFLWPVAAIVARGLASDGVGLWEGFAGAGGLGLVWFTLWQAAASTLLTVVLGLPLAWLTARVRFRGQWLFRVVVTVPFVLPTVVVGVAFRTLFAPGGSLGFLGLSETVWAVLLAHAYFNVSVVARIVGGVWSAVDPRAEQAARTLGAGPARAFLTATAPALLPAIASAASVVFLFCATSFGIILVVGGSRLRTLETAVYQEVVGAFDLRTAALLALVQITIVVLAVAVSGALRVRVSRPATAARVEPPRPSGRARLAVLVGVPVSVALLLFPLGALLLRSLRPDSSGALSLDAYRRLTSDFGGVVPVKALTMSLVTAAQAGAIALLVGGLAAVAIARSRGLLSRFADAVVMLPLGVSAVTLGFGYLLALQSLPAVRESPAVPPFVQALVALPLVVRVLVPALGAVDPRQRQAAAVLGASPVRVFTSVDLPVISRSVAVAAGFAYVVTLGEFGAASFLVRPEQMTLPVLIGRISGRPGWADAALAASCSVLLIAATVLVIGAVEALRRDDAGRAEF